MTITNRETNSSEALPSSTISLNRSGFIKSSRCIGSLPLGGTGRVGASPDEVPSTGRRSDCGFRLVTTTGNGREPPCLGRSKLCLKNKPGLTDLRHFQSRTPGCEILCKMAHFGGLAIYAIWTPSAGLQLLNDEFRCDN